MNKEIRSAVLKRDRQTCQACGKSPASQVHHIKARRHVGRDELSNLVTLCGRCHMIISPAPPFALWRAFRVRKSEIPAEKKRIEKAIKRFQESRASTQVNKTKESSAERNNDRILEYRLFKEFKNACEYARANSRLTLRRHPSGNGWIVGSSSTEFDTKQ